MGSFIIFIVGLLIVTSFLKIFKISFKIIKKIIVNSITGYVILLIINFLLDLLNISQIDITFLNAFLTGIFGTLWVFIIFILKLF